MVVVVSLRPLDKRNNQTRQQVIELVGLWRMKQLESRVFDIADNAAELERAQQHADALNNDLRMKIAELEATQGVVVEQIIRPTGLLDPEIEIRKATGQVDDLLGEIFASFCIGK